MKLFQAGALPGWAGRKIAQALSLNSVFLCEFEELRSPKRKPADQVLLEATMCCLHVLPLLVCLPYDVGARSACLVRQEQPSSPWNIKQTSTLSAARLEKVYGVQGGGVHGNALLTRFDMTDCRAVEHR